MLKRTTIFLVVLLSALISTVSVYAQNGDPGIPSDDEVNAIAKQLYCPVCENIPLDVCGTQACAQWRELIREKLSEGWNETQIKNYFVDQYGDRVLAAPPARGLNWLVYIVPPVAILAGAYILYRAFKAWQKPLPEAASDASLSQEPQSDEYVQRLEEQLRNR
jgi:cytochrome c-type biogenesis protein CcmH